MKSRCFPGLLAAGIRIAVCLALPALAMVHPAPSLAGSKVIEWNDREVRWHSFSDGLRAAQATGKPILAVFYADWCPHCAAYSRLFHIPEVVRLSQNLVMVKVDSDGTPEINQRYAPDGGYVPRTMVLRPDGSLVASLGGSNGRYRYFLDYTSANELASIMRRAITVH